MKNLLKRISRMCVSCQRTYAQTSQQLMREQPTARIPLARPLSVVRLDFAGPVMYKEGNLWKPTMKKDYICAYVCFVVKAVHLDLTDAFLASLHLFVAFHGAPSDVYSDNGSNYRGADLKLQKFFDLLEQDRLQHWAFTRSCQ